MQDLQGNLILSPYIKEFMTENQTTKAVELNIGERLAAVKIFDAFKGNISTLATIIEDVKQFPVTDEEWKAADLVKVVVYKVTDTASGKETFVTKEYRDGDDREAYEKSQNNETQTCVGDRENWKWNETGEPKKMELRQGTVDYLLSEIKKKDDANEITITDLPLVNIQAKLK